MKKLIIPDEVNVAGMVYSIVETSVVIIDGNANYAGKTDYGNLQIDILKGMPEQRQIETFFHELFHAILFEVGFKEHDEELVERTSKVLYQVMKDNYFYDEEGE